MLLDKFFTITEVQPGERHIFTLALNPEHPIFDGHFPGNPIVPGVCLTQMVKESLEYITQKKLFMLTGDNLKFTAILNPNNNPIITLSLSFKNKEPNLLQADATITDKEVSFFSFKGSFKEL